MESENKVILSGHEALRRAVAAGYISQDLADETIKHMAEPQSQTGKYEKTPSDAPHLPTQAELDQLSVNGQRAKNAPVAVSGDDLEAMADKKANARVVEFKRQFFAKRRERSHKLLIAGLIVGACSMVLDLTVSHGLAMLPFGIACWLLGASEN